jgi:hypothetical protein
MKTFNCTIDGEPLRTPRYWYDPWCLVAEMIFFAVTAIFLLVMDLMEHFMGGKGADTVGYEFKERMIMAYTTVPHYLKQIKGGK